MWVQRWREKKKKHEEFNFHIPHHTNRAFSWSVHIETSRARLVNFFFYTTFIQMYMVLVAFGWHYLSYTQMYEFTLFPVCALYISNVLYVGRELSHTNLQIYINVSYIYFGIYKIHPLFYPFFCAISISAQCIPFNFFFFKEQECMFAGMQLCAVAIICCVHPLCHFFWHIELLRCT